MDLNITNTSTLVLSLQNAVPEPNKPNLHTQTDLDDHELQDGPSQYSQYSFTAASRMRISAPPVSLLALIDHEEYVVLPNATSLVPVRMRDLNSNRPHSVRVIAPMIEDDGQGAVQLDGLWLDRGGQLSPIEGTTSDGMADDADDFGPESPEVGRLHQLGLSRILSHYSTDQTQKREVEETMNISLDLKKRRKLVEVVTDQPAHLSHLRDSSRTGGSDGLLAGVMGWEYLLGEMYSVDHVCVGVEGMCLTHDCIGGTGEPSGMGDVFFRR